MEIKLLSHISELGVDNVFIYVGDAVRWDALPTEISQQGTAIKTIAASTYSPSSFASLVTGLYTPVHSVRTFSDQVPVEVPTLFDVADESVFINSIFAHAERAHGEQVDPIYSLLRREPPADNLQLDDLSTPFIAMERGPGGHAPYGDFDGTAMEYFLEADSIEELRRDYRRSIELDYECFEARLDELSDAGVLDDTLVIYTSDHGELLGEGGMVGHNSPMRPELVHVPTVFIHPSIPEQHIETGSFHHVDLIPTILDSLLLNTGTEFNGDGQSLVDGIPTGPRPTVFDTEFATGRLPFYEGVFKYEGAWSASGGYTFARTPITKRLAIATAKIFKSSKKQYMRENIPAVLKSYSESSRRFDAPSFSEAEAEYIIQEATSRTYEPTRRELSESAQQHLHDLGYK